MACKYLGPNLNLVTTTHTYVYKPLLLSRWLRLLFGREFSMENLLQLWDAIFAEDPSLNIVEYVSLVLLIRIRDKCKHTLSMNALIDMALIVLFFYHFCYSSD